MWYFRSPQMVFGEAALEHLDTLAGKRAFIVTDRTMVDLGFVNIIADHLQQAGLRHAVFSRVEPEPSLQTVYAGATELAAYAPDWIIGLGGGSAIDAAKAMWVLYENPDLSLEEINPFEPLNLRRKARLIAIPTTSGTGSEATWGAVLTDTGEQRKIAAGGPEMLPDIAIVDPSLPAKMPLRLTADTGMDVLTHAVEGYTATFHNDFTDGLCLKAIDLVFEYLPRVIKNGTADMEAREKMHNAATLAGLGFGNSMAALAHSLGHSLGAIFHVPHGRAVGLFLPCTIEFIRRGETPTRFYQISRFLGLPAATPAEGAESLAQAVKELSVAVGQPTSIKNALNASQTDFEAALDTLVDRAEADSLITMGARIPTTAETYRLFRYAYEGKAIDF